MNQNKKISKYILTAIGTGILLLSAGFIYAQTSRLDELKEKAMMRSEQTRERMGEMKKQAKDRVEQLRERIQQKTSKIREQRKKDAANRIANQLNHINEVWTDHFTNVLDKLDAVLQKIKSRTEKAAENGQDVSSINTAIQKAETAIASARTAVLNQAQKTYNVDSNRVTDANSTEASQNSLVSQLRTQFRVLKDQLREDLTSLRDGVMKDARNVVHDTFQALRQVRKVDNKEPDTNQQ